MKAIYYDHYGSPDVLTLRDLPQPKPKPGEVLVKVKAASINSWDWDMIRGEPWIVRAWGLTGPRHKVPGADIAGIVSEVGPGVTQFKQGDEVFGDLCECGWGGYAEYVCAKEEALFLKPSSMSFEQAAAIPQAGLMALQAIDKGRMEAGQKLLMNGAGGGVGTFAIQIAKALNIEVTAVDRGRKLDALRKLGADHVINYEHEDFTKTGLQYDVIVDVVAKRSVFSFRRALKNKGQLIIIGGDLSVMLGTLLIGSTLESKRGRRFGMLAYRANKGLDKMSDLFARGAMTPIIDSVYPLEQTPDAFRHFASGSFLGKVIISVEP